MTIRSELAQMVDVLSELERSDPDVVRLARVASLAVRVEPHLLRRLRIELVPDIDVGTEADLWFSDLVETAGARFVTLRPDVGMRLRHDLAADKALLDRVRVIVRDEHTGSPASLRLEEELHYLALGPEEGRADAIDTALRPALRTLSRHDDDARNLAQWVLRAAPQMFTEVLETRNGIAMTLAAGAVLGRRRVLDQVPECDVPVEAVTWALPRDILAERTLLWLTLVDGGVRIDAEGPEEQAISIPTTIPRVLELSWTLGDQQVSTLVQAEAGRTIDLGGSVTRVDVKTMAGDMYAVSAVEEQDEGSGDRLDDGLGELDEAYALLDCPTLPVAGTEFELTAGLSPVPSDGVQVRPIEEPGRRVKPYILTVQVVADGFDLRKGESWRHDLAVTEAQPYPRVTLHLTPEDQSEPVRPATITATYTVDGQIVGTATRAVAVVLAGTEAPDVDDEVHGAGFSIPTVSLAPDLTVAIHKTEELHLLRMTIASPHDVPIPDGEIEIDIGNRPDEYVRNLTRALDGSEGRPELRRELMGHGRVLAGTLPAEFWDALRAAAAASDGPPTLLLLSAEGRIPWELAVVDPPLDPALPPFLSTQTVMGRWVLGDAPLPPPHEHEIEAMAVITGDFKDLARWETLQAAFEERDTLQREYQAEGVDATFESVTSLLQRDPVPSIVHVAVHGKYKPNAPDEGLILTDGTWLTPRVIRAERIAGRPFVFLNACQVGSGSDELHQYTGLAAAFLASGASGVIAPMWSVKDEIARDIAVGFYAATVEQGVSVGEAIRREREAFAREDGDEPTSATFMAYQYFGHPLLRLRRPEDAERPDPERTPGDRSQSNRPPEGETTDRPSRGWSDVEADLEWLSSCVRSYDRAAAGEWVATLVARLIETDDPYPAEAAVRVLNQLRSARWMDLAESVAQALIQTSVDPPRVRLQYAQVLMEGGKYDVAVSVLGALIGDLADDAPWSDEARGLLGRCYKQMYLEDEDPGSERNRRLLSQAIDAYGGAYRAAPLENLWQGVNMVALLERAQRDGVEVPDQPTAEQIAGDILAVVERRDTDGHAERWDLAVAMEASLALGDDEAALEWLGRYVQADAGSHELTGTLHQLEDVWQLGSEGQRSTMLTVLRSAILAKEGGSVAVDPGSAKAADIALEAFTPVLQKVLGTDGVKDLGWYRTGLTRSESVVKIYDGRGTSVGTGFLLAGSVLSDKLPPEEMFVITNSHVVSESDSSAIYPEDARIGFEALGLPVDFLVAEIVFSSPYDQLDVSVLRLERPAPQVEPIPVHTRLPVNDGAQRVYVVGYPSAGSRSISLQDNLLLDLAEPKLHYRASGEPISPGSPIFDADWNLIGLHHANVTTPLRPRKSAASEPYAANEGLWIEAILRAIDAGSASK